MKRVPTPLRGRTACLIAKNKATLHRAATYLFPNVGYRWAINLLKKNFKLYDIAIPWKHYEHMSDNEATQIEKLENDPTRARIDILKIHRAAIKQAAINCNRCSGYCRCDEEEE